MNPLEPVRTAVIARLREIAGAFPTIRSLSIVGSFVGGDSLDAVADIDVVIVVDELRSAVFEAIVDRFARIAARDLGLPGYRVRVNPTFGPLKFDDEDTVVFHVMVYDRAGHRDHVIKSPFTCLDWERHDAVAGLPLRDIYSAGGVQPEDIIASRRGIDSYLADLAVGEISYREYDFSGPTPHQVSRALALDPRHTAEFAYHILRNLFLNTLKVLSGQNAAAEGPTLLAAIRDHIAVSPTDGEYFLRLHAWKRRGGDLPPQPVQTTTAIVHRFHAQLEQLVAAAPRVIIIRHGRTADNDGSFLGIRRDPPLIPVDEMPPDERKHLRELAEAVTATDRFYSSPLRRARETAEIVTAERRATEPQPGATGTDRAAAPNRAITGDDRLREIDYGAAEGLHVDQLARRYPDIPTAWSRGEDPPFPEGENQAAVAHRLTAFISDRLIPDLHAGEGQGAILVTHNVVIRALLGVVMNAPVHRWHRLQPRHLEPLAFRVVGETLVPALTAEQRTRFRDQLFQGDQS